MELCGGNPNPVPECDGHLNRKSLVFFSPCDMSVLPSPPQNGDDFACKNDMI
jgi:hypothetical protein